jgi:enoyl-CoA hydratase/carnithine racemase
MELKTLLFGIRDHVAHITLNRPDVGNSINEEMAKDLMHAVLRGTAMWTHHPRGVG